MRCKSVLYLFGLFFSLHFSAQELTISLSQYSNKRVFIRAVHGIRKDTIGSLLLDKNGYGTLAYTTKQAFTGLVNLTVEGKEHLSFDFVLSPKENPILSCDGEYLHSQNTTLLHTSENDCPLRCCCTAAAPSLNFIFENHLTVCNLENIHLC